MSAPSSGRLWRVAVLSPPLIWTIVFMFIPYSILFVYSFWEQVYPTFQPAFQFGNYLQIITDPQYFNVLSRTLKIALFVSLGAMLVAFPYAYFLVFKVKSAALRQVLYMAVVAPLWVSYLLRAYTWKTILGTTGILNSFLMSIGVLSEPSSVFLYNQTAMIVTLIYVFIPFMVMPIYAVLEKIPKSLTEASNDLGVGRFRTFFLVTLPLSIPGIVAGFTMTFCLTFGDFIAPFLVGGPDGLMVANVIASQFGAALNWPLGAALALVMMLIVLTIVTISDRFEQLGKGKFA